MKRDYLSPIIMFTRTFLRRIKRIECHFCKALLLNIIFLFILLSIISIQCYKYFIHISSIITKKSVLNNVVLKTAKCIAKLLWGKKLKYLLVIAFPAEVYNKSFAFSTIQMYVNLKQYFLKNLVSTGNANENNFYYFRKPSTIMQIEKALINDSYLFQKYPENLAF